MPQLKVLLLEAISSDGLLEKLLDKKHYAVVTKKFTPDNMADFLTSVQPDCVIFNAQSPDDNILQCIKTINQTQPVPAIIFADDQNTETINKVIKAGVSAYIVDGMESKRINTIITIAKARFEEQQQLKNELEKTKLKLEERKLLDRAKAVLMNSQGFSEDTAYHTLRKLAMERNISIGEMAKNVISMASLLTAKVD